MKKLFSMMLVMASLLCVCSSCSKDENLPEKEDTPVEHPNGIPSNIPSNIPTNTIYYITSDGIIVPLKGGWFCGSEIVSNTYSSTKGYGTIEFASEVTAIEANAFKEKEALTYIALPNSVMSIGWMAFDGCHFATENFVNNSSLSAEDDKYWGATLHGYETEDGLLIDSTNVAYCRKSANIVTIPNSVTSIGDYAFSDCSGLTSVTIPNSVTSIGDYAFSDCSGLTSVTIPNSVTSIGDDTFRGCSGLTSVTIPNSVTSIGGSVFYECSGLTSVIIGNSVTSIGSYAFYRCSGLTSVTIPNSVTSIGYEAFWGCSGLTSVTIPNSVRRINDCAFKGCSGLTSVTIPNSVEHIGEEAFRYCSGLTSVSIGNSVTSIGYEAFRWCRLQDVYCYAEEVPSTDSYAFRYSGYEGATLHVPAASIEKYKSKYPWSDFGKIVTLK